MRASIAPNLLSSLETKEIILHQHFQTFKTETANLNYYLFSPPGFHLLPNLKKFFSGIPFASMKMLKGP